MKFISARWNVLIWPTVKGMAAEAQHLHQLSLRKPDDHQTGNPKALNLTAAFLAIQAFQLIMLRMKSDLVELRLAPVAQS